MITMNVRYLVNLLEGEVKGCPAGFAGDVVEVPFSVGAHLVASGAAESLEDEYVEPVDD